MRIPNRIWLALTGAATIATLAVPVLTAQASQAATHNAKPNATTVCGTNCQDISGKLLGPNFILNVTNKGALPHARFAHRLVNMRNASDQATNEDFRVRQVGTTDDFCTVHGGNGQIPDTAYVCVHLPNYSPVFQAEFSPNSVDSNYCAGALAPTNGFKIRLLLCGTARTFFVEDTDTVVPGGPTGSYVGIILATDTRTSDPLVPTASEFSGSPSHQVFLSREHHTAGTLVAGQLVTRAPLLAGPA
jgi:hypothetical protein